MIGNFDESDSRVAERKGKYTFAFYQDRKHNIKIQVWTARMSGNF